jgi:hypothetical protein
MVSPPTPPSTVRATPRNRAVSADARPKPVRQLEIMAVVFLLVGVGRVGEIIPGLAGVPLVKVALGVAIISLISGWKSLPPMHPAIAPAVTNAKWLMFFVFLSVPFSIWPGPSVAFLYQVLPVILVALILFCKLSGSWISMRKVLLAILASGVALAFTALLGYAGGRIEVASMYDTNDLAYVLVSIFPLALGFAFTAQTKQKRLFFLGVALAFVASILLTSSRGGLLGLISTAIILVLHTGKLPDADEEGAKREKKKRLSRIFGSLFAFVCVALLAWPMLPPKTQERLGSVLALGQDYNLDPKNVTGRSQIWKRGMTALKKRPIGYGANAFRMVDLKFGGRMLDAHSSLVKVSVELGVIAFLLYLRMYYLVYRALGRARALLESLSAPTPEREQQATFCRMLQACLIGNFIAGAFLSMCYAVVLWATMGVALGVISLIHRDAGPRDTQGAKPMFKKRSSNVVRPMDSQARVSPATLGLQLHA